MCQVKEEYAMGQVKLVNPKAETWQRPARVARGTPWDGEIKGKVIGLVDNGRPNAGAIERMVADRLVTTLGIRPYVIRKIDYTVAGQGGWSGHPLPKDVADKMLGQVGAVLTGLGN